MSKELVKDSAVYLAGSVIVQAMNFIGLVMLMRFLPVGDFGKYTYIVEFIAIFAFFSDGGFTQFIVKETVQNPERTGDIYARARSAQRIVSLALILLIAAISFPINSPRDFYFILIYGSSVVLSALFSPLLAVLIASGRKDIIFFKDVSLSITRLFFIAAGVFASAGIEYFIWLGFINCIVLGAVYLKVRNMDLFKTVQAVEQRFGEDIRFIRQGLIFTTLMAANVIYNKIDILMLEKMRGSAEVAYYSGATRFIYPFMFVSTAFMTAIFPTMARYASDKTRFRNVQRLSVASLGGIGIFISITLYFCAGFLFETFFDQKYDQSIGVFQILVWYLAIVFTYGPLSNSLVAQNRIRFLLWLNVLMILANVLLNMIMIPEYGAQGAAAATIGCECFILVATAGAVRFGKKEG